MAEKKKLAELDKAIGEKRAELKQARQEKQAAAQDPERLVLAEKAERRISGQLQGLEAARAAATYTPPAPSDAEELLQGLQKYRDAHAAKVEQVRASISCGIYHHISPEISSRRDRSDSWKSLWWKSAKHER